MPVDDNCVKDVLGLRRPFVVTTYTDHGNSRAFYVFAFGESRGNLSASFKPADFGISGNAHVYDYFAATGTVVNAGSTYNFTAVMPHGTTGGSYFIVVPIGSSGIALVRDTNKFVTRGKKRISSLSDNGQLRATVAIRPGGNQCNLVRLCPVQSVCAGCGRNSRQRNLRFRGKPVHCECGDGQVRIGDGQLKPGNQHFAIKWTAVQTTIITRSDVFKKT